MKRAAVIPIDRTEYQRQFPAVPADVADARDASRSGDAPSPFPSIDFDFASSPRHKANLRVHDVRFTTAETRSAIESMPHLANQVSRLWKTRDLNSLIHSLLLDSRDGSRDGFPYAVARELMFLAKINLLLRAAEAAPLLDLTLDEAIRLIEKGDHAAIADGKAPADNWGPQVKSKLLRSEHHIPASPLRPAPRAGKHHSPVVLTRPEKTPSLAPALCEMPPVPPSVCIDLTASGGHRSGHGLSPHDDSKQMERGFFRCITKELSGLNIPQLVLADLGTSQSCSWLPSAISFAKSACRFPKVILQIDPLSALEALLVGAMSAGLDQLVITFNLASGKWRAKAETLIEADPEHFLKLLRRLLRKRDEIAAQSGRHCQISVVQINQKTVHHLSQTFIQLSREPGLSPFQHVATTMNKDEAGSCHCWSPFIEAHVRTNGHLVACAQDHSGYSFMANLKEITFTDAWHGQLFQNTRQKVLHGDKPGRQCEICPHCLTNNIAS